MGQNDPGDGHRQTNQSEEHEDVDQSKSDLVPMIYWPKGGPQPATFFGLYFKSGALHPHFNSILKATKFLRILDRACKSTNRGTKLNCAVLTPIMRLDEAAQWPNQQTCCRTVSVPKQANRR